VINIAKKDIIERAIKASMDIDPVYILADFELN